MSLITITTSIGSSGIDIGRRVATALSLDLYDDQRIKKEAIQMGVQPNELEYIDEKKPWLFDRMLNSKPEAYKEILESVVYQVAQNGEGVIIGHGSQVLLQAFGCALHIYVHASETYRIEKLTKQEGINPESAKKLIWKSDTQKKGFMQYAYGLNWEDPGLYDLIINTEKIGVDWAAKIIIETAKSDEIKACSLTALEEMRKLSLERSVSAAITKKNINLSMLSVEILGKGVVVLRGIAHSEDDREQALKIVKTVHGVVDIESQILIVPSQWE